MAGKARNKTPRFANTPTRDAILEIAEAHCAAHGPDAIRLRTVAAELGIEAPSIYAHFANKDAILTALAGRALQDVLDIYADLDAVNPEEALRVSTRRQVTYFARHPGRARIILADLAKPGGHVAVEANVQLIYDIRAAQAALLRRGRRSGHFRAIDAVLFNSLSIGAILAALAVEWLGDQPLSPRRVKAISDNVTEMALRFLHVSLP